MPKITIREVDETTAYVEAQSTDIVYIPGFANTNTNCYISDVTGAKPTDNTTLGSTYTSTDTVNTPVRAANEYPSIYTNTADRKSWTCQVGEDGGTTTYTWTLLTDTYFAPAPENEPTLCNSVDDFVAYFGETPYLFTTAQANPQFAEVAQPEGNFYEANQYERSYIMAKELLANGLPVLYDNIVVRSGGAKTAPQVAQIYSALPTHLGLISDKGEYDVKYITSGAYPTFEYDNSSIAVKMITAAKDRGDAVAIIDHTDKPSRPLKATDTNSVYYAIKTGVAFATLEAKYATMFTPWATYICPDAPGITHPSVGVTIPSGTTQVLPASFAYLISLAKSIKNNPNWLAIAGVARGQVPNIKSLHTDERLTNAIADSYQPRDGVSLNAITNIRPYGLTIWGNRTLHDNTDAGNLTASSFLNIRNLVDDVKKVAYVAAKKLIFEQDSNVLWLNFKSAISPTLDQMLSGYGISGYKILRGTTKEKAKVVAIIRLYPTYAVEDFDITVIMSDEEVTVS